MHTQSDTQADDSATYTFWKRKHVRRRQRACSSPFFSLLPLQKVVNENTSRYLFLNCEVQFLARVSSLMWIQASCVITGFPTSMTGYWITNIHGGCDTAGLRLSQRGRRFHSASAWGVGGDPGAPVVQLEAGDDLIFHDCPSWLKISKAGWPVPAWLSNASKNRVQLYLGILIPSFRMQNHEHISIEGGWG